MEKRIIRMEVTVSDDNAAKRIIEVFTAFGRTLEELGEMLNSEIQEPKLPESWIDLNLREQELLYDEDTYETFQALSKLYDLRKAYWKAAGDWKPDYESTLPEKWGIYFDSGKLTIGNFYHCRHFLIFRTKKQAEHFLKHHEKLIIQAKDLL